MKRAPTVAAAALLASACQTMASQGESPAALDAARMDVVKETLAETMGRASVELGPSDRTDRVVVLPPRLGRFEDRSTAVPVSFRAVFRGDDCFLVEEKGSMEVALPEGICQPV